VLSRNRGRQVDEDEIVRAAAEILTSEGPFAVTADRLSRSLHLPEKHLVVDLDALIAQAYRIASTTESAAVKRAILANPSPVEQMRALLAVLATPPEDDSDAFRLEAWVAARRNPALREAVQESAAAWHALVASVIRRGARTGHFQQADADEVAEHVIALIEGVNSYQVIDHHPGVDRMRLLTRVLQAELGMSWGPDLTDALA
jgi:AcrR family transcriptional regulator